MPMLLFISLFCCCSLVYVVIDMFLFISLFCFVHGFANVDVH